MDVSPRCSPSVVRRRRIFSPAFEDVDPQSAFGSGDVKYHRGATGNYKTKSGKTIEVRLASNPSHLEAVNPVVAGRVRAWQERLHDTEKSKVLAILIHGDAALAGQGLSAECLNLSGVDGFDIGGVIHIVANNLVGFTASPYQTQSSRYCTDVAKRLPIPIWHVNAEAPDDTYRVGQMAMEYRSTFKTDVVIDLIGYRRFGHNEGDDPTFTLPLIYQKIEKHPYLYQKYGEEIGLKAEEIKAAEDKVISQLTEDRDRAQTMTKKPSFFSLPDYWNEFVGGEYHPSYEVETKVPAERIKEITIGLTTTPQDFTVHPKMQKLLEQRREMGLGQKLVDFGFAENLAFGSLVTQNIPVRLSGQDCRRATFSHRQSVLVDYKNGTDFYPLNHLQTSQARYDVYDSVLSEAAVVGFEYGYSRDFPEALVCWEGQFGDFRKRCTNYHRSVSKCW